MTKDVLTRAILDLLYIPPLIHRGVRRAVAAMSAQDPDFKIDLTPQQVEILSFLDEKGVHRVAEIGKKLQIAKAQMTQIMDKLAERGLINRETSSEDRRAINISLSSQGRYLLAINQEKLGEAVRKNISQLSDEDLNELSASLQKVRDIMDKIDD
jgi:DNA-binding MarR family transcriptional regulator